MTDMGNAPILSKMSQRLVTVAEMLRDDSGKKLAVADVGCDHGYVSIYLIQSGIASSAVAMDVRQGPLSGASDNIREYGLLDVITTRLSDGLKELKKGEADSLIIAGMGGKLMMRLVKEGNLKELGIRTAVLQPQSDISEFRAFLREEGFFITDEKMILEDGKYYFPMKVVTDMSQDEKEDTLNKNIKSFLDLDNSLSREDVIRLFDRYGVHNLLRKDPLLKSFLEHGKEVCESILKSLDDSHLGRITEIKEELSDISFALKYMDE
ncbi:tRNA (adenine22-N1)-methyltransferase [Butyrivibrio hungatei DSM 14810]|uniref:tRNA (Adenine22-N1)-methyltransferase n=1 Tax=Butyrivibrio hungatei DSM 14810 TaxID=1121132 RepID=A0A1M7S339_9FIRM|nr:class I SAM-dependent methyltransferase [Butyrivibrio hungatei]SHN52856.1 tRNA (adenine22-N1)-methyltransferase [Butyrivibrio hungatei DSM 14810]